MSLRSSLAAVAFVLMTLAAHAQSASMTTHPEQLVERFLVPIYAPGPTAGAFGSLWQTELSVLNTGGSQVFVSNLGFTSWLGFFPVALLPGTTTRDLFVTGLTGHVPAVVLRVAPQWADQLEFQLGLRDTSRQTESWGVWLPVVHESEFVSGQLHLLSVPTADEFRLMLRVYSLDGGGRTARVRIYGHPELGEVGGTFPPPPDTLLDEFSVWLEAPGGSRPAYAQVPDSVIRRAAGAHNRLRLTVEPEGAFGIWAMASVTNNVTQEVTMVMPGRR